MTIASTLSGKLAIKHPTVNVLCREDGMIFNAIRGSSRGNSRTYSYTSGFCNGYGYCQIQIKCATYQVHRLIAEAFLENKECRPQVDHIDRNRQNNSVGNLRWVTGKENMSNIDRGDRSKAKYGVRPCENSELYSSIARKHQLVIRTPEGRLSKTGYLSDSLYDELKPLSTRERTARYLAWKQSQRE